MSPELDMLQRDRIRASILRIRAELESMYAAHWHTAEETRPENFMKAWEQCRAGLSWLNDIFAGDK